MGGNLWVLGSSNLDTTWRVDAPPERGATLLIRECRKALGGKGANAAVVAARMGANVRFIGCVGADEPGAAMCAELASFGIDTDLLSISKDAPSGCAFIAVGPDGSNLILVEPGANQRIPSGLAPGFQPVDFLLTQYEVNRDARLRYMGMARRAGARTMLNPSPFALDEDSVRLADFLFLNEVEAANLTGRRVDSVESASGAAQALAGACGTVVTVTLGADGAVLADGGKLWWAPGCPVRAVDTQGAGDTFLGVFAASLQAGHPLEKALLRANVAAALSVEHHGSAQASFPGMDRVDEACPRQQLKLLAGG